MRWTLLLGGIFNFVMGLIFFSNRLVGLFLQTAVSLEASLFGRTAVMYVPQDPVHLMLIHGFGAAAMILGATLIVSFRDPVRYLMFILLDGFGRLLFGSMMVLYVFQFDLVRVILLFAVLELLLGLIYVIYARTLAAGKSGLKS